MSNTVLTNSEYAELVLGFIGKGEDAFTRLAELHRFELASRFAKNYALRNDAEDLANEALFKAWKNCSNYDPRQATFFNWLGIIAMNKGRDLIRGAKRRPTCRSLDVIPFDISIWNDRHPE